MAPSSESPRDLSTIRTHADLAGFDPRLCVVKLGSAVLTTEVGRLDEAVLDEVARFAADRAARGRATLIVSSGAVASGIGEMELGERPGALPKLQALAAIGQSRLMASWGEAFGRHDRHVAQILLSAEDFRDRRRYLNMRYTLETLFEMGVTPIVNENDTITVEELRFGENDGLAMLMAIKMVADCLVYLTNVGGLYRRLPRGDDPGEHVDVVEQIGPNIEALVAKEKSKPGTGGMASKLVATREATRAGIPVVIAGGKEPGIFARLFEGRGAGTLFVASPGAVRLNRRDRFIAFSRLKPRGRLWVDEGATRALTDGKKSLLPAGVTRTEGDYARGYVVDVVAPDGTAIARGLANYSATEVEAIRGHKTSEIAGILGRRDYDEVIHRDNLVVMEGTGKSE